MLDASPNPFNLKRRGLKMGKTLVKVIIAITIVLIFPVLGFGSSATISWNKNTDDDLGGYKVYYGTKKGGPYGSSTAQIAKTKTSCTISDLSAGTYYFVVVAIDNSKNESIYSSEVTKTIVSEKSSPATTTTTSSSSTTTPTKTTTNTASTSSTKSSSSASSTSTSPTIALPANGIYGQVSGNASQADQVSFSFPARSKKVTIIYQGYNMTSDSQVSITINGTAVGYAAKTKSGKWGGNRSITIPRSYLNSSSTNTITFKNSSVAQSADSWGVRNIKFK
jgi:hypothetical protein